MEERADRGSSSGFMVFLRAQACAVISVESELLH